MSEHFRESDEIPMGCPVECSICGEYLGTLGNKRQHRCAVAAAHNSSIVVMAFAFVVFLVLVMRIAYLGGHL